MDALHGTVFAFIDDHLSSQFFVLSHLCLFSRSTIQFSLRFVGRKENIEWIISSRILNTDAHDGTIYNTHPSICQSGNPGKRQREVHTGWGSEASLFRDSILNAKWENEKKNKISDKTWGSSRKQQNYIIDFRVVSRPGLECHFDFERDDEPFLNSKGTTRQCNNAPLFFLMCQILKVL